MARTAASPTCLNCTRTDADKPLLQVRYRGVSGWLCVQCLPLLIHHPEQVSGKLDLMAESGGTA